MTTSDEATSSFIELSYRVWSRSGKNRMKDSIFFDSLGFTSSSKLASWEQTDASRAFRLELVYCLRLQENEARRTGFDSQVQGMPAHPDWTGDSIRKNCGSRVVRFHTWALSLRCCFVAFGFLAGFGAFFFCFGLLLLAFCSFLPLLFQCLCAFGVLNWPPATSRCHRLIYSFIKDKKSKLLK